MFICACVCVCVCVCVCAHACENRTADEHSLLCVLVFKIGEPEPSRIHAFVRMYLCIFVPPDVLLRCVGCVLDSPFSRLPKLMQELASRLKINVGSYSVRALPSSLANFTISAIRNSIRKRYDFDIETLDAETAAENCYCPALFGHGSEDDFIVPIHGRAILENWQGDSHFELMKANHNSARPGVWYAHAAAFLARVLIGGLKDADRLFDFSGKEVAPQSIREEPITSGGAVAAVNSNPLTRLHATKSKRDGSTPSVAPISLLPESASSDSDSMSEDSYDEKESISGSSDGDTMVLSPMPSKRFEDVRNRSDRTPGIDAL